MASRQIHDSPRGWVRRHIREYVETGGRKGHRWSGVDTLLLTTRGRKTGKLRRTAPIYGRDRHFVVESAGGARRHPSWYLNLRANADVHVRVGAERFDARARTASPRERPRLWRIMTWIWPEYDRYQDRTGRETPVVVIEGRRPCSA